MVSIVACTMRPEFMRNIFRNYERQRDVEKELILVINNNDINMRRWRRKAKYYPNVRVYHVDEKYNLGKCLNFGIRKAKHRLIAKFDDDDYYGPDFLKESVRALDRGKARIIGKHSGFVYFEKEKALMLFRGGKEREYVSGKLMGGTLVFRKSVWEHVKFSEKRVRGSDASFLRHCKLAGYKLYSVSRYNYVCVRRADTGSHTQKTATEKYMKRCRLIRRTDDYRPYASKRM
ncbi:glycosyltransferase [Paenibacillus gansuensis]|uniref:Glycosyltransferase n=1 Tax=Paenibacillus gansuensis TaxID=306542 RepID=A0ABW5PAP8_9BACL